MKKMFILSLVILLVGCDRMTAKKMIYQECRTTYGSPAIVANSREFCNCIAKEYINKLTDWEVRSMLQGNMQPDAYNALLPSCWKLIKRNY